MGITKVTANGGKPIQNISQAAAFMLGPVDKPTNTSTGTSPTIKEAAAFLAGAYEPSNVASIMEKNGYTGSTTTKQHTDTKVPKDTGTDKVGGSTGGTVVGGSTGGYDYASMIQSALEQQRAAAQAAYNNAMGRLQSAWGETQSALRSNLDNTLGNLRNQYDYSSGKLNEDANKSLREAYISYMLNKKNLNQGLSAMGLSGGATESTQANMYNNYGNSRNNINTTLADNLASLLNNYQNSVANANQLYNTQYADAMNNFVNNINGLESALANNMVSTYSGGSLSNLASFASQLGNLTSQLASAQYTPTQNTLGVNAVNTTQANDMGTVTDYAKYLQTLQNEGMNSQQALQQMVKQGYTPQQIFAAFNS